MTRREIGLHHTIVHTTIQKPGFADRKLHVLYVLDGPECQPLPLIQLIEYFLEHGRTRSLSWQKETARAVGLFIDFLRANAEYFRRCDDRPQVLEAFADALVGGTAGLDGCDTSGLWWEPKTIDRATALLNAATSFSDWLVKRYATTALNPWKTASMTEQMAYWRRFDKRRAGSILAHTASREKVEAQAKNARQVQIQRKRPSSDIQPAKFFPEDRIWDLLFEGFAKPRKKHSAHYHERYNIRDILITTLLHGGGLRESEPFHLYVSDVSIDRRNPKMAVVRLYHPEQGRAPADYANPISGRRIIADREEYLRVKWKLQPRNLVEGRFHAGWKDLQLSHEAEKFTLVNWFPDYWGELFLSLFRLYITHCRSRHFPHPYLFVSHKEQFAGAPYTIDSFRQSHSRAVRRIGLVPAQERGTSPHGHRHAYGQRMSDSQVPDLVIQRAMHHKSPLSQKVYTEPSEVRVEEVLREAQIRLGSEIPQSISQQLNIGK